MHQLMAVGAIPLESIESTFWARYLDDHANAARLPLGRMPHVLWQQKNIALFDRNFNRRLSRRLHQPKKDVTLQLIKEFFRRIVMVIAPLIRPAHNRDHDLAVFPHLRVADWR